MANNPRYPGNGAIYKIRCKLLLFAEANRIGAYALLIGTGSGDLERHNDRHFA